MSALMGWRFSLSPYKGPEGDDVELHVGDDSGQCGFALLAGLYGRVSESGIVQAGTRIAVQFPELAFLLQVRVEAGFIQRVGEPPLSWSIMNQP